LIRRAFTSADIQAEFEKYWGKPDPVSARKLKTIQLVTDLSRPLWVLTYETTFFGSGNVYGDTLLLTQKTFPDGSPYIACCDEVELPVGCKTVREENVVLKAKKDEKEDQHKAVPR
jgi:hypothetical protein